MVGDGVPAHLLGEADGFWGLVGGGDVVGGVQQPGADDGEDAHEDGRVSVLGRIASDEQHKRLQEQLLAVRLKQHLVGRQLQSRQRRPRQRPIFRLAQVVAVPVNTAPQNAQADSLPHAAISNSLPPN